MIELKYTAFGKKKKVVEIDFQRLFKLNYLTSVSVICNLASFMMYRNVDFMGFSIFQLLMKLGDFDLALVLIRQKSDKTLVLGHKITKVFNLLFDNMILFR